MRFRASLGVLSLVLAAAATAPGVSYAAVTTIGPPTLSTRTENTFIGGTFIQFSGPGPAAEYVSPIEGTIVTWRIASGSSAEVRLRVLRPAGGGNFTGVGTSAMEITSSPLDTFATSLPIKAGDIIAADNANGALIFTTAALGFFPEVFASGLADGAAPAAPSPVSMGSAGGMELKLQINADIQPAATATGGGTGSGGGAGGGSGSRGGIVGGAQPRPSTLAGLKVVPSSFIAAGSGGSIAKHGKKTGATVSYTDSQAASTTFIVLQKQPGRRNSQGVCARPARKPHGRPCTRLVRIGSFTHTDTAGANSFHFSGRVNGRKLAPGGYQLQAVARDAAGLTSKPAATGFGVHT
jgi:hypothetical protein